MAFILRQNHSDMPLSRLVTARFKVRKAKTAYQNLFKKQVMSLKHTLCFDFLGGELKCDCEFLLTSRFALARL